MISCSSITKSSQSSENHVNKTAVKEIKRVEGKFDILLKLTEAALDYPDGMIKNTIYPVVDIETLKLIKADLSQRGNWYKKQVRTKMRSLYSVASYGSCHQPTLLRLKINQKEF